MHSGSLPQDVHGPAHKSVLSVPRYSQRVDSVALERSSRLAVHSPYAVVQQAGNRPLGIDERKDLEDLDPHL